MAPRKGEHADTESVTWNLRLRLRRQVVRRPSRSVSDFDRSRFSARHSSRRTLLVAANAAGLVLVPWSRCLVGDFIVLYKASVSLPFTLVFMWFVLCSLLYL